MQIQRFSIDSLDIDEDQIEMKIQTKEEKGVELSSVLPQNRRDLQVHQKTKMRIREYRKNGQIFTYSLQKTTVKK
jgi:hypothetical protein